MLRMWMIIPLLFACVPQMAHMELHAETSDHTYAPITQTVCNSYGLHVRECPSTECKVVGWLQDGDKVVVRSESIRWTKIVGGWVRNRYLCQ